MGSFNVGCGLSHLSIHEGDRTGFIFITAKPVYPSHKPTRPETRTMHIYTTDLYEPYLPPVYGTYDDYGNLANLEASPVTEIIESIFRRPALDVINAVGQDRGLYSQFGGIAPLYLDPAILKTVADYSTPDEAKFIALGFTPIPAPDGYAVAYEYGEYELWGKMENAEDPQRKHITYNVVKADSSDKVLASLSSFGGVEGVFSSFSVVTKTFPGFAQEDWFAIRELLNINGMFFLADVYEELKPKVMDKYEIEAIDRFMDRFEATMKDLEAGERYSYHMSDLTRDIGMKGDAWAHMPPMVDSGEYAEIARFTRVMGAVNRMLMPSLNGEQFGNDKASLALNRITTKLLKERKRRYDEDEY